MKAIAQRLDQAAGHLHSAAAAAEQQAGDDVAPELHTLAALSRATAALISSTPDTPDTDLGIDGSLNAALEALDAIDPGDGPADLPVLAWHVHDLRRVAAECSA